MSKPLVSVVMSVYNGETYLSDAIESILTQTFENFEFIIVNDGSIDKTMTIINDYCENDKRIVLINRENRGLAYSLNEAIGIAKGKYIARMDADDISLPDRLLQQLAFIESSRFDFTYCDTFLIDKDGEKICKSYRPKSIEKVLDNLTVHNYIPHPTVFVKKSVFLEYGTYDTKCRTGQDVELWLRLKDKVSFGYLPQTLLLYRINPSSVRAGANENYWLKLANYAIWNNHRFKAFHYLDRLSSKEKLIVLIKMLLPHVFYLRKQK